MANRYPGVVKRGASYGAQAHLGRGKRRWTGSFDTPREAYEEKVRIQAEARENRPARDETCGEFAERYPRDYNYLQKSGKMRWGPEHLRNLTYALKPFILRFGSERLARFPKGEARPWVVEQPESVLRAVRAMFNDARSDGRCEENPFENLGLERSRGRQDIIALTVEEQDILADCAVQACGSYGREILRPLIIFQNNVGTRRIGMANMRPDDVDLEGQTVYVRYPGKGVKAQRIALFAKPAEAIARMPARLGANWLFVSKTGRKVSQTNLYSAWNETRVLFESKLDPRRLEELRDSWGLDRHGEQKKFPFHGMRHNAATNMARLGVSKNDCAWQLCQSDDGGLAERVYTHLTDEERIGRIQGALAEPAPQSAVQRLREASNG